MIFLTQFIGKFARIIYLSSKYQIFDHYLKSNKLTIGKKILIRLITNIFYPKKIFIKNEQHFGKRLTKFIQELGPIYIKLGQTLSTRQDIVGNEIANHLKILQDSLPPFNIDIAKKIIEDNLKSKISEIFIDFDHNPVASASISQVYKAQLSDKKFVAIKILRPNITNLYKEDINFLFKLAKIINFLSKKVKRLKLQSIVQELSNSMLHELDLKLEASACSRLQDNFKDSDLLYLPKIYWEYTTSNMLVTEWVEGVSIYEINEIAKLGFSVNSIIQKIAVIFFQQAFQDGFFHADMHPGNILILKDGRIALLDFGIIGTLDEKNRLAIAEILYALSKRDYLRIAIIHKNIGYIPQDADINLFAQHCRAIAEPMVAYDKRSNIFVGNILANLFKITELFGMETQEELLFLQKTLIVVEGIGHILNPNVTMWELAEPWIIKWGKNNLSQKAKITRVAQKIYNKLYDSVFTEN